MNPEEKTNILLNILDRKSVASGLRFGPRPQETSCRNRIPEKDQFSIFNPRHSEAAWDLTKLLFNAKDFREFSQMISEIEKSENEGLFLFVLYSCVRHRRDCKGVTLPPIEERNPHWFFSAETIHDAIQRSIHDPDADHEVENEKTALDSEPESRLAYFREDIGLNRHHWFWHVIFPLEWDEEATGIIKDRKGELFYYMHQQMIARYDCERLSNNMERVTPLDDFEEELPAYSSNMTSQKTGVHFAFRPEGLKLRDISRDGLTVTVREIEQWKSRILGAIEQGHVHDDRGERVHLMNERGIDILGAIVESNSYSVNRGFYGNFHNMGHVLLANVQDPDARFKQHPNVMGFNQSSARDPVFYRWHKLIDYIFHRHKAMLKPYSRKELHCNGIRILSAKVMGEEKNVMKTFMRQCRSDLSQAFFLKTNKKILVKYEHLDHEPLTFIFKIENYLCYGKEVTIRVFLSPKYDERGKPFSPDQQRMLMIELDKIRSHLHPGQNTIVRKDCESSVTIKRQIRSYRWLKAGNVQADDEYCSCGWPEHLLIPRGKPEGMDFNLFVMCTNSLKDKPDRGFQESKCGGAVSYCGSKNQKYPDTKPMGFPFDRRIICNTMNCFMTNNMVLTDVKIKFEEKVLPPTEWNVEMYEKV